MSKVLMLWADEMYGYVKAFPQSAYIVGVGAAYA